MYLLYAVRPRKSNMTMESSSCEDVFLIENGNFPMSVMLVFRGVDLFLSFFEDFDGFEQQGTFITMFQFG